MLREDMLRKIKIDDYAPIVGQEEVDSVEVLAEPLKGRSVTHVIPHLSEEEWQSCWRISCL